MAIGRLLGGAAGLGRTLLGGGYSTPPSTDRRWDADKGQYVEEEREYDQMDPRRAYWRGLSMDLGRAISGLPQQDMANQMALGAEEYNRKGPERLRAEKQAQILDSINQMKLRAGQRDEAQAQQTDALYQQYAADEVNQGRQPLPQEAWLDRMGISSTPSAIQVAEYYASLPDEPDGTGRPTKQQYQASRAAQLAGIGSPAVLQSIIGAETQRSDEERRTAATQDFKLGYAATKAQLEGGLRGLDDLAEALEGLPTGPLAGPALAKISEDYNVAEKRLAENALMHIATLAEQGVKLNPITENELQLLLSTSASLSDYPEANKAIISERRDRLQRALDALEDQMQFLDQGGNILEYRGGGADMSGWSIEAE